MRWGLAKTLQFLVLNLSYLRNFQLAFCSSCSCFFKSDLISSPLTPFNLIFTFTLSPSCPSHALLSPSSLSSQTPSHHWKSVSLLTSHPTKLQYECPQQSLPVGLSVDLTYIFAKSRLIHLEVSISPVKHRFDLLQLFREAGVKGKENT